MYVTICFSRLISIHTFSDRDRCDDFRRKGSSSSDKSRLEQNENGLDMLRQAYKETHSRDSTKSVDSAKSSGSRNKRYASSLT